MRFDLDHAVEGWRGTVEFRIQTLQGAIEGTELRIATLGRKIDQAKTERGRTAPPWS
ncbi:hypothetical protein [Belnapia rosea]|uniref:hypothetical protein n=1 Tax=Belnapia rosea TaxID=938405 RepID=UPI0015A3D759|nr:hypothetical protein [Belnapia rosea]